MLPAPTPSYISHIRHAHCEHAAALHSVATLHSGDGTVAAAASTQAASASADGGSAGSATGGAILPLEDAFGYKRRLMDEGGSEVFAHAH